LAAGKWISDLKATTPLTDAARHVLTVRLEVVRRYLPLALREADKDPEHVHQLRVGTRRARAALDIFASCLPKKVFKGARKHLRDIRRVAGEARDWDVFLADLTEWSRKQPNEHKPGLDCLFGYVVARREAAQAQLEEAGKQYPFTFERFLAETVASVQKPSKSSLRTLLDLALPQLEDQLDELHEAADQDLEDFKQLHQVRIIGKRLRYAMEVFADCFAAEFRNQLYPAVEQMQEMLGNANDSYVACGRLEILSALIRARVPAEWERYRPALEGLLHHHQTRLPQERQRFVGWWHNWCRSGGLAAFTALLKPSEESGPAPVMQAQEVGQGPSPNGEPGP
jgi:CHAD domain-containing protein